MKLFIYSFLLISCFSCAENLTLEDCLKPDYNSEIQKSMRIEISTNEFGDSYWTYEDGDKSVFIFTSEADCEHTIDEESYGYLSL
jgi:hypothetical protein